MTGAAVLPPLWLPPAPAVIRPAEHALLRPGAFRPMSPQERRATVAELVRAKRLTFAEAKRAMFFVPVVAWPAAAPVVLAYIGSASSTANATTYSLGSFTAATDGLMIVGVGGGNSSAIAVTSISIGGSNGTLHTAGTFQRCTAIASRAISAGSIAVSATFGSTSVRAACFVWLLTGYKSATPTASVSNGSDTSVTSIGATLSSIKGGGAAVYVHHHNGTGGTTWSAATERDDFAVETTSVMSGADKTTPGDLTSNTETASFTSNTAGISGASWR